HHQSQPGGAFGRFARPGHHEQSPSGDTPPLQGSRVFRGAMQPGRRRKSGWHGDRSGAVPAGGGPRKENQTARRLRPLARRALRTARPARVFMRTRNPWVRLRRVTEGWKVRFMVDPKELGANGQGQARGKDGRHNNTDAATKADPRDEADRHNMPTASKSPLYHQIFEIVSITWRHPPGRRTPALRTGCG